MIKAFEYVFAAVGGFLGYYLGGFDGVLNALLTLTIIDYITGVLCAVSKKELSSGIGFVGISRKILIFALVGVANIVDNQIAGNGSALRTATIFFYMANEAISIVENAASLGIPLPKKLVDVLKQLRKTDESEGNNDV